MSCSLLRTKTIYSVCTLAMKYVPSSVHFQPDSHVFTEDDQLATAYPVQGPCVVWIYIYLRDYTDKVWELLTSLERYFRVCGCILTLTRVLYLNNGKGNPKSRHLHFSTSDETFLLPLALYAM